MIRAHTVVYRKPKSQEVKNITAYVIREENRRVRKALKYVYREVLAATSVTTYSLRQLRSRDYPYARRHGRIQKGKLTPLYVYNVHKRTGKFQKGFKIEFTKATITKPGAFGRVYYESASGSKWARAIFRGSKKMMPRNPIRGVVRSARVKKKVNIILFGTRKESRGVR